MKKLSAKEFRSKKKSDTIVVYGSGYSIKKIINNPNGQKELNKFDSISFNWFCKSKLKTTFYVVREQANIQKRVAKGETVEGFIRRINKNYSKSCLIVHDVSHHSPGAYNYSGNIDQFTGSGVVVKDLKLSNNRSGANKWSRTGIFEKGVIHGECTLNNIMHIIIYLGYKKVIFAGIDLYDSRYFWLEKNKTRKSVKDKGRKMNDRHSIHNNTIGLIKLTKKHNDIKMYTYNKKSLLNKVMRTYG